MTYHAMMFFWELSKKHWIFKSFEWIGDFLEDWGLDHGHITLNSELRKRIEEARAEWAQEQRLKHCRKTVLKHKRLGDLLAGVEE